MFRLKAYFASSKFGGLLAALACCVLAGCTDPGMKLNDNQMVKNFRDRPQIFKDQRMNGNFTYEEGTPLKEYAKKLKDGELGLSVSKYFFDVTGEAEKVDFVLTLPRDFDAEALPNAKQGDNLYFIFDCKDGSRQTGNVVISVE